MTAKKSTPQKPVSVKPTEKKVEEKPQHLTDIDNLKKEVQHLVEKGKSHGEQIKLVMSIAQSCEGQIKELHEKIKKVAAVAGVLL